MMSRGRGPGQPGARVRGYTRLNQLAASRSSPGSRGTTMLQVTMASCQDKLLRVKVVVTTAAQLKSI